MSLIKYPATKKYLASLLLYIAMTFTLSGSQEPSIPVTESEMNAWEELAFRIEDSKTRVGLASVNLVVSELKPIDGELIGHYEIQVPLMSSKNDSGKIVLPINKSVGELGTTGGVLRGTAISERNDKRHNKIVCEIRPLQDQAILLAITTSERTLHFESRYTVIEVENGS